MSAAWSVNTYQLIRLPPQMAGKLGLHQLVHPCLEVTAKVSSERPKRRRRVLHHGSESRRVGLHLWDRKLYLQHVGALLLPLGCHLGRCVIALQRRVTPRLLAQVLLLKSSRISHTSNYTTGSPPPD